jgi:hypothetical protein
MIGFEKCMNLSTIFSYITCKLASAKTATELTDRQSDYDQHRTAIAGNPDGTVQTISTTEMERIDKASMGMAALIRVYGDNQGRHVKYEEEKHETNLGVLWRVKCVVDGIELGEATRADKQTAKNVAAWTGAKKLGLAVS